MPAELARFPVEAISLDWRPILYFREKRERKVALSGLAFVICPKGQYPMADFEAYLEGFSGTCDARLARFTAVCLALTVQDPERSEQDVGMEEPPDPARSRGSAFEKEQPTWLPNCRSTSHRGPKLSPLVHARSRTARDRFRYKQIATSAKILVL